MRLSYKITTEKLLYFAIVLMLMIICLPITIALPGIVRQSCQAFSIGIFITGMCLQKDKILFVKYIFCVVFARRMIM